MNCTYAIGDIHGRIDVLETCLQKITEHRLANNVDKTTIVFLGDYIDRGMQSKAVVERLMAGPTDDTVWKIVCGNHEEMAIMAHHNPDQYWEWWCRNGGLQTSMSYGGKIPDSVLKWFTQLPDHYEDDNRYFVHAGVDPAGTNHEVRLWVRWQREAETPFRSNRRDKYVVHGHTPFMDGPVILKTRCNLDTAIYRTGRAAIAVFDDAVEGRPIDMLIVAKGYDLGA